MTLCSFANCQQSAKWLHPDSGSLFCDDHYQLNRQRIKNFHCNAWPAKSLHDESHLFLDETIDETNIGDLEQ